LYSTDVTQKFDSEHLHGFGLFREANGFGLNIICSRCSR